MTHSASRMPLHVLALVTSALALTGCHVPTGFVFIDPERLVVQAGTRATVTVTSNIFCLEDSCIDTTGRVFEFVVQNLPSGITYTVDTSLRSPSTPGLVRIAFDVAGDVLADTEYTLLVHAVLDSQVVATKDLPLEVLPSAALPPLAPAVDVAAGFRFSVARLADGTVAAWGSNEHGELGQGDRTARTAARAIPGLQGIVAVAAGTLHALALSDTGVVWAWGANFEGQLGEGRADRATQAIPAPVRGLPAIHAIAAGYAHSLALDAAGAVWAWGRNETGELGDRGFERNAVPVRVAGLPAARAIAAGGTNSFAIDADGMVWTWGDVIMDGQPDTAVPVQMPGLSDITAVAPWSHAAFAIDGEGALWAWGLNGDGRLGNGTLDVDEPTPVAIGGLTDVVEADIDVSFGLARAASGVLWQLGRGPLGGDGLPSAAPALVLSDVVAVAAGFDHAVAVLGCGQVWAWGMNGANQLGASGLTDSPVPTLVPGFGDDSGCAKVTLDVVTAGDAPRSEFLTGELGPGHWTERGYRATLDRGTTVTISARTPMVNESSTLQFARWTVDCDGADPQISIVLDRSKRCAAVYENVAADPVLLSVVSEGGLVISSPHAGILGPTHIDCRDGGPTCQAVFNANRTINLSAEPSAGFAFSGWGAACAGAAPETSVAMDGPKTCIANFRPYTLEVTVNGAGRVVSVPAGIDCGTACSIVPRAATATLIATADLGWEFGGWGGSCAGTADEITVAMTGDQHCTAAFRRTSGTFLLTVQVEGQGSVTSQPSGIACPGTCVAEFAAGTPVDLTAAPEAGWMVSLWFDDCLHPGVPSRRLVMDADKHCRIQFLGQAAFPVAGFVHSAPGGAARVGDLLTFNGNQSHLFDPVTGTQDLAGIRGFAWDLDGDDVFDDASGSRGTAAIVQHAFQATGAVPVRLWVEGGRFDMADVHERSLFIAEPDDVLSSLTVGKGGGGAGAIVSSPLGLLRCTEACASSGPLLLHPASTVTLVAQPAPGSRFTGWSGAGCTAATAAIEVLMSEARTCTATFEPEQFTLTVSVTGSGSVVSTPGGIDCGADCGESYPSAGSVTLTAAPAAGFEIGTWTGCDTVSGDQCTVAVVIDRAVGVTFVAAQDFTVVITLGGPAGAIGRVISLAPSNVITCGIPFGSTCIWTFAAGTTLVLQPDSATLENDRFAGWSGCDSVGVLFTCSVTLTGHRQLTATLKP